MTSSPVAAQRRLTTALARRRRLALGPVLAVDDAALDARSAVSDADQAEVEAFVRSCAGQKGVALLDAGRGA